MSKSIQLKKQNENIYPHPYYPVGSIYLSVVNTNPSRWFGGTWEQIAKGRTLVGVDINDTDFNTVEKTGGSKFLQQHKHGGNPGYGNLYYASGGSSKWLPNYGSSDYPIATDNVYPGVETGNSGNLQPYFTCYIWCRTA